MNTKNIYKEHGLHLQEAWYACGPATIRNVLTLLGKEVPAESMLIADCDTNDTTGTTNEGLRTVLEKNGCAITEEKANASLRDIEEHLAQGRAVLINYFEPMHQVGHYAVVESIDNKALYIWSSKVGMVRIEREAFEKIWHDQDGIAAKWFLAISK